MGLLHRFLTGDVLDERELAAAQQEGVELHLRKLKASVAYDHYRAPGRRFNGKRQLSSGGVLVTRSRVRLWAGGVLQLDLSREQLPASALEVTADARVLQVAFDAEAFHTDRSGRVRIRLWTPEARRVATILGS